MEGTRIGFIVRDAANEYEAIQATWSNAEKVLPVSASINSDDLNRNQYIWNIGLEEVDFHEQRDILTSTGSLFYTYVQYRQRFVAPEITFDGSTQTQTVFEGSKDQFVKSSGGSTVTQADQSKKLPIGMSAQDGQMSVSGANMNMPLGGCTVIWHPRTVTETPSGSRHLIIDEKYHRRVQACIGKVHGPVMDSETPFAPMRTPLLFDMYNVGEVMLTGYSGRRINPSLELWELRYSFAVVFNQPSVQLEAIDLGPVEGWEFVWGIRKDEDVTLTLTGGNTPGVKSMTIPPYELAIIDAPNEYVDLNQLFYEHFPSLELVPRNQPYFKTQPRYYELQAVFYDGTPPAWTWRQ